MKELMDMQQDKDNSGVMAYPLGGDNVMHLKGVFPGPPDSPYAGGTYQVDITIPDNYPFKSPAMKFDTRIWHPNVSSVTVSGYALPCSLSKKLLYSILTGVRLDFLGGHLSRHPWQRLVSSRDYQDGPDLASDATREP
jgi:hypothetical protein